MVACLRDTGSPSARALSDLPRARASQLIFAKLDSSVDEDAASAIQQLTTHHAIPHLDVVIANAGISNYFGRAAVTPAHEMMEHFRVNAVAPLLLFQATAPLLERAPSPRFVVMSSAAASLDGVERLPVENTAYGASKAAVNFVARRIHYENPGMVVFPISPGWLRTDVGFPLNRGWDGIVGD